MRILDLFCCEGGAGAGYLDAGWTVTGVDRERRFGRRYPGVFFTADALEFVATYGHEYDAIHASPPCQGYSRGNAGRTEHIGTQLLAHLESEAAA